MPKVKWRFTGSVLTKPSPDKDEVVYGADLTGTLIGKEEVQLSSNDQEFWYWIKQSKPPYLFHCSYQDLAEGKVRQMPFPFQPDWLMEALGMGEYGPPENYQLRAGQSTLELVENTRSPQGQLAVTTAARTAGELEFAARHADAVFVTPQDHASATYAPSRKGLRTAYAATSSSCRETVSLSPASSRISGVSVWR